MLSHGDNDPTRQRSLRVAHWPLPHSPRHSFVLRSPGRPSPEHKGRSPQKSALVSNCGATIRLCTSDSRMRSRSAGSLSPNHLQTPPRFSRIFKAAVLEVIDAFWGRLALIWAQSRHSERAPLLDNIPDTAGWDGGVPVLVCRLKAQRERACRNTNVRTQLQAHPPRS